MKVLIIIFLIISILFALGTAGFVIYDIICERRKKLDKEAKASTENPSDKKESEATEKKEN